MNRTKKFSTILATIFMVLALGAYSQRMVNSKIANGGNHALVLKCNGQVNSWGLNASGQLGDNSTVSSSYPATVRGVNGIGALSNIIAVAAGVNHSLAITCDGAVVAWGSNTNGQLGDNTTNNRTLPVYVLGLPNGKKAVAIAAGETHSMALLNDGSVWAWGNNQFGQLGKSGVNESRIAIAVAGLAGLGNLTNISAIACGLNSSMALLNDGTVRAWGRNNKGQLGLGNNGSSIQSFPAVTLDSTGNAPINNVKGIACGNEFSLFILKTGYVQACGDKSSGQLGDGTITGTRTIPGSVKNLSNVKSVCAGWDYTLAIKQDSTVWAWGNNTQGQLGTNSYSLLPMPTQILGVNGTGFLKGALGVACGLSAAEGFTTYIVSNNITSTNVAVCGNNTYGKLGGSTNSGVSPVLLNNTNVVYNNTFAHFNLPQQTICINSYINLNSNGSTSPTQTYNWDFGKSAIPSTSSLSNPPAVVYSTPGIKTITLIVNDGQCATCTDTFRRTITVVDNSSNFTSSSTIGCQGELLNFYPLNTDTNNVRYFWDFGTTAVPTSSTAFFPTGIVYNSQGTKEVKLYTTSAACGISNTTSKIITINPGTKASFNFIPQICEGSPVQFTNTSSPVSGLDYYWDFDSDANLTQSIQKNPPKIIYTKAGVKNISLAITNQFGCHSIYTASLTVMEKPKVSFTSTSPGCTGSGINFLYTGSGSNIFFNWNFGLDASTISSNLANPVNISYAQPGIKTVNLLVSNNSCKDSVKQTLVIHITPTSTFSSTTPQCSNNPVNFFNKGNQGSSWSYSWNFGTGAMPAVSTTENPTGIIYQTGGSKLVSLTVNDAYCSHTDTQTVIIQSNPIASFTSTAPVCSGLPVNFSNTGTNSGVNYSWNFGLGATPGVSTAQNPTGIIFSSGGIKTIKLILSSASSVCKDSIIQTLIINQTPTSTFKSNAPQCAKSPINFTNTGSHGNNWMYNWSFGNGANPAVSTSENPVGISYTNGGSKKISLTVSDGICAHTDTVSITVYSLPNANAGTDTTICANASVQLGVAGLTNYAYSWFPVNTLNNGTISNPVASPDAPVTQYILNVTDKNTNCNNSDTVVVTMLSPLIANAGTDATICKNDSVQLGTGTLQGQTYSWQPVLGLNNPAKANPVSAAIQSTTYTLTVRGHNCPAVTDEVTVTVHQLPKVYAGEDDTLSIGASIQLQASGALQYNWSPFMSLNNSGIYNPIASPQTSTNYVVIGKDIYGCTNSDSVFIKVIKPNFWVPKAFTPDGNGTNDVFYVRGYGIENFEFRIYNQWGELLFFTENINQGWDGRHQMNGKILPQGSYIYNVRGKLTDGTPLDVKDIINLIR